MPIRKTGKSSMTVAKSAVGTSVVPVAATESLARVPIAAEGEVARDGDVVMVAGVDYLAHGTPVPAKQIFFDGQVRPKASGPWLGEADKVAWLDSETGFECIILRDAFRGFLGGYVGVPSSHPLYRFEMEAVPADIGIEVHGGLTYAAMCQDGPSPALRVRYEARRICHVAVGYEPITAASDYRIEDRHVWWFGFTCDHISDVIPGDKRPDHARHAAALGVVQVYRDDAYVFGEVLNLARQLRAIADGRPVPPRVGPPLPPASLDQRAPL